MPYQTAGSVILKFPGHENNNAYYRELDISRAVALTRYTVNGVTYTRETFSSFVDNVIIMHITASKKGAVNFDLSYTKPASFKVSAKNNVLVMEAKGANHEGVEAKIIYQTHSAVKTNEGKVSFTDSTLSVSGATVATIYISIGTNFIDYKTVGADYEKKQRVTFRQR
ncbi:glycoside hydrolase family 95 protein [Niabella hibiscisoli]|uniref:glycoside hydrolase family 95 protein n=1 Tax=Niabella hibiscisoli TaxID=1825928 RepID=UPI0021D43C3F|nr:glycoside hydrolase family 95 protein [Niabella hibiscisoli]